MVQPQQVTGPGSRFSGRTQLQVSKPCLPGSLVRRQGWARGRQCHRTGPTRRRGEHLDSAAPGVGWSSTKTKLVSPQNATAEHLNLWAGKHFSGTEVAGVGFCFGLFGAVSSLRHLKDPWRSHHGCPSLCSTPKPRCKERAAGIWRSPWH